MSDLADIQWFSGESDGPKPAPKKCPLPRIGSKEWGWELRMGVFESPWTDYRVAGAPNKSQAEVWDSDDDEVAVVYEAHAVRTAKRIAEVMARRDWRKENGKK